MKTIKTYDRSYAVDTVKDARTRGVVAYQWMSVGGEYTIVVMEW
jgi:hypothetical protein